MSAPTRMSAVRRVTCKWPTVRLGVGGRKDRQVHRGGEKHCQSAPGRPEYGDRHIIKLTPRRTRDTDRPGGTGARAAQARDCHGARPTALAGHGPGIRHHVGAAWLPPGPRRIQVHSLAARPGKRRGYSAMTISTVAAQRRAAGPEAQAVTGGWVTP